MAIFSPLRGHPDGLAILFFTEMWERFSYYGMRALLVLYLVNALDYPRDQALALYATYTALVYLTPILGGYIADRWLGAPRAVMVGGVVMALGHFAMAVPALLHLGLGLLVAGNGFFKPNISSTVGHLYGDGDPRRDSGYTVFYMGVNLGAFLAPLVCGTLGEKFGWHYGFATAGVGMLIGMAVYARGLPRLGALWPAFQRRDAVIVALTALVALALVLAVTGLWPSVNPLWSRLGLFWQVVLAAVLLAAGVLGARRRNGTALSEAERRRILAMLVMMLFVVFFWMGFEQAGGTMNLFADQRTDRHIFGWEMPATYFQAVNPLLILLLAPVFAALWTRLDRSRYAVSAVIKQAVGMMLLGSGFVVLAIADAHGGRAGLVGPQWLLLVYALHTTGELCLSPIGLSMVSRLAPARLASLMMGLWFTAMALANYLAGTLEALLAGSGVPLYWFLVASSIGAGAVLLALAPPLHRWMQGAR